MKSPCSSLRASRQRFTNPSPISSTFDQSLSNFPKLRNPSEDTIKKSVSSFFLNSHHDVFCLKYRNVERRETCRNRRSCVNDTCEIAIAIVARPLARSLSCLLGTSTGSFHYPRWIRPVRRHDDGARIPRAFPCLGRT